MREEANSFAKTAAKTAGLSETAAKKYLGTYGAMAKNFTSTEEEAYEMAEALTQLTGDVASFYNLDHEEAATKLKSVFTGETESLKELGIVMTQTALNEYAMQRGMKKTVDQMTPNEKAALRYRFVLDQLSTASGDFARTSEGWANQTRILALQFENIKASLGQGLINILDPAVEKLNTDYMPALQGVADKFAQITENGIDFGEVFGDVDFDPLVASLGPLGESFEELGGKLQSGLSSAWNEVLVPLGTWTIEEGLPAGIDAVSSAIDLVSAVAEKAAPLVSTFWNEFAKPIGEGVGDLVTGALEGFATGMENLATAAEQSSTTAAERVIDNWDQAARATESGFIVPTHQQMLSLYDDIGTWFSGVSDNIVSGFNEAAARTESGFTTPTAESFQSMVEFISSLFEDPVEASNEMATNTAESFNDMQTSAVKSFSQTASNIAGNWSELEGAAISASESIQSSIDGIKGKTVYIDIYERYHSRSGGGAVSGTSVSPTSYEPAAYTPSVTSITPQIPYLATGAVIPPRAPFMAVLGDQKNGTNIEAPLDTIKQAVSDVIGEGSIEVLTRVQFEGDLAQLGRFLKPVIDAEAKRKGGSLAKGAVT